MFLRLFHIALILSYFFCCHAEIIAAPFVSSLSERAFQPLKNDFHPRTESITLSLPKHINSDFLIKIDVDNSVVQLINAPHRPSVIFYDEVFDKDILQAFFDIPLNKAPPSFSF